MCIVILASIIVTTIVYSAFSTQLQISGEAIVRSDNDIRITNVSITNQTSGAYETYSNKYTKDTTSQFVSLTPNSTITYQITITNKSNVDYVIYDYEESNSNSNVFYTINNLSKEDIIYSNSNQIFSITFTNTTAVEQSSILLIKYLFEENKLYTITYDLDGGLANNPISYTKYTDTFTLNSPSKDGYVFKGWQDVDSLISYNAGIYSSCITNNGSQYTYNNQVENNVLSYFKIQLYTSASKHIKDLLGGPNTKSGTYLHTLESGMYKIRFGINGSKQDYLYEYNYYLEENATYLLGYTIISFNQSEVIAKDIYMYKDTSSKFYFPLETISKYSFGNRNLKAIWKEN